MTDAVFSNVQYPLRGLIQKIEIGELGLPDLQRPFVWKNAKVRDLFDSMYRGYPVGYLLLWKNALDGEARQIGVNQKQKPPELLIVDGQQRLTSLYAVFKGIPVIRENYSEDTIQIAFNPLEERFEVADAAVRRDKSFIPNVSVLWSDETDLFELVSEYLNQLGAVRELSNDDKKRIKKAISRVEGLGSFPFTALELSSGISEEQVSEVFVRINSKGKPLNQADFILTLMSVFWDDGRRQLEAFCREARTPSKGEASAFNHYLEPDPDQLLRVSVGLAFRRARLKHVYSLLRGKDLETGEFTTERRESQFKILQEAQSKVLNLQHWHDFFKAILLAGYRSSKMIGSRTALLYSYTMYLLGRTEFGVDEHRLRPAIARWFFMSAITGRYSSSPESVMEFDLAQLRGAESADEFLRVFDGVCASTLTNDFWSASLVTDLAKASSRSPSQHAYYAALNLLDAKALYSKHRVSDLFDPTTNAARAAMEKHHLFPKAYLKKQGFRSTRETNQIANYALVEWHDNADVSDQAPADYGPKMEERYPADEIRQMYHWHALPDGWWGMGYATFLAKRRELMARIIQEGYAKLNAPVVAADAQRQIDIGQLVEDGESMDVEFKSTLRKNLHTDQKDPRMEHAIVKTVAGFLNAHGGTLVIGVADDGSPVGIEVDEFANEDKMALHLTNLLKDKLGAQHLIYVHPRFEDYDGARIMAVACTAGRSPVYMKDGNTEKFYVRTGPSTTELKPSEIQSFVAQRF